MINHLDISENSIFFIVSTQSAVEIYQYDGTNYQHQKKIVLNQSFRKAFITPDNKYIIINDEASIFHPDSTIFIYRYNEILQEFEKLLNSDPYYFENFAKKASLSNDRRYLAVSTNTTTYFYSDPLSNSPVLEQSLPESSDHQFSYDGKYLFLSGFGGLSVYINCNWNTTGGYFYNENTTECELCDENCYICESVESCEICN